MILGRVCVIALVLYRSIFVVLLWFFKYIRDYLENSQIDPPNVLQVNVSSKILELTSQKKSRIVWCDLLTSTKRKELLKLLDVSESMWLSLVQIERMLDQRSKQCVDCGRPYEIIPFDRGCYQGDNEPDITTTTEESCSASILVVFLID